MTVAHGEPCGSFFDATALEVTGHAIDVTRYAPSTLGLAEGATPGHNYTLTAMAIAASLARSYQTHDGRPVATEALAKEIAADSAGTHFVARLAGQGGMAFSDSIVACLYTEQDPDEIAPVLLVNALEVPLRYVSKAKDTDNEDAASESDSEEDRGALGRFAASALLHCLIKNQPDDTTVLFLLRRDGAETRGPYFESLGVEVGKLAAAHQSPRLLGTIMVGDLKRQLEMQYGLRHEPATPQSILHKMLDT